MCIKKLSNNAWTKIHLLGLEGVYEHFHVKIKEQGLFQKADLDLLICLTIYPD
jgi:hypothetical protein